MMPSREEQSNTPVSTQFHSRKFEGLRPEDHCVKQALARVPFKQRDCLLLQVEGGFSQRDIAELLGISFEEVRRHISKGREQFRRAYHQLLRQSMSSEGSGEWEMDPLVKPCPEWQDYLAARHPDDLSLSEQLALDTHRASCSACMTVLTDYDLMDQRIHLVPVAGLIEKNTSALERDKDSGVDHYIGHPLVGSPPQHSQKLRLFPMLRGICAIVLLLVFLVEGVLSFLLLPRFPTQNYIGVRGDIKVAQIRVEPIKELPKDMNVYLTLFDNDGYQRNICNGCTKRGDQVILQGNLIKDSPWLGLLGWPLGFKLTRFEWHSQKSNFESNTSNFNILNDGDDSLFTRMQDLGWLFVTATHSNRVVIPADGKTYNIFISQTGILYIQPAK